MRFGIDFVGTIILKLMVERAEVGRELPLQLIEILNSKINVGIDNNIMLEWLHPSPHTHNETDPSTIDPEMKRAFK